ncbi:MAG: 6-bladed beta-propeller [Cytophagia bacterium]|nr:6-bladed beta-propeller [Cytophagia bacterium]
MIQRSTRNTLFFLFLCLVIANCSESKSSGIVFKDGFASIPIDIDAPKRNLSDFVETVEVIQLEETPNSLMGSILEYEKIGENIILRNFNTNSVIQFTEEGKYISSFSKSGNGPKEYSFILSFWVDGESVFIYDSPNGRVQEYDIQGIHKSSTRISQSAINSIISKSGKFYLSTIRPIEGTHRFYTIMLDSNGAPIDMQIPYEYGKLIINGWGYSDFALLEGELMHHYANNDTVYIQRDGQFEPYISFDFGDNWAWKGVGEIESMEDFDAVTRQKGKVFTIAPIVSNDQVYLSYLHEGSTPSILVDLKTGKSATIRDGYSSELRPIKYEAGQLVYVANSTVLADFVNSLNQVEVKYLGHASLESIESSENPALVKVKFKDSSEW